MAKHRFHHHIEYGGRQWISLGDASISAERFSVVTSRQRHNIQPIPIPTEEAEEPRPHAIYLKDIQETEPVQCIGLRVLFKPQQGGITLTHDIINTSITCILITTQEILHMLCHRTNFKY